MDVSVVVPVLNEPDLTPFLSELHRVMRATSLTYEVAVIASDREKLSVPIPKYKNQSVFTSYGDALERAILLGFSVTTGDIIVVCDADGSHPPKEIPWILRALDAHDLAIGSRFVDGGASDDKQFRKLVTWCFARYAQFFGSHLSDPMSGFFAVKRELVEKTRFKPFKWKVALELELKSRVNVAEVPFHFKKRQRGVSKASIKTGLKILKDIFSERM